MIEPTRDMMDLIEVIGMMIEQGVCDPLPLYHAVGKAVNEPPWRVRIATEIWAETHVHKKPHACPEAFVEPVQGQYYVDFCPQCDEDAPMWKMPRDGQVDKGRCLRCGREAPRRNAE